jgi:hypothetical protein
MEYLLLGNVCGIVTLANREGGGVLFILMLLLAALSAAAPAAEPEGGWIADAKGCKIYNPSPKPGETVQWSGPCKDGVAEGKGVLEYSGAGKPGARYEGTLKRGKFDGRGRLKTADGAVYDGDWIEGAQEGYGEYTAPDGATFRGGWTAGKPDGPGVLTAADGKVTRGVWSKGQFVAPYPEVKSGITRPGETGMKLDQGADKENLPPPKKED